jgi:hypothetical protein
MAYNVKKIDVWSGEIRDRAGALAAKLQPLARAGADLSFVIARRQPHKPGRGIVFVGGVRGPKAEKAARKAAMKKSRDLAALRVEAPNKAGDCQRVADRLAKAGVNLRGLSASVIGKKYVLMLAFDSASDAAKAARALRR